MTPPTLPASSTTPALIIGGGPSGLTTALLLASHGIRSTIVERHITRTTSSLKAHAINPRSLEIFRQLGLDTARLRREGIPPSDGDTVRFAVSMAGRELGSLPYERQGEETLGITAEPLFNVPQPVLERWLLDAVENSGLVGYFQGVQWEDCDSFFSSSSSSSIENGDARALLSSTLTSRTTNTTHTITSNYILDCSGAHSRARAKLAIPFEPLPEYIQNEVHHVSVHIRADLRKFKPATLLWAVSPRVEGTFICYGRATDWVFVTYYDPKVTPREKFSEEAIGEKIPYEIQSITVWSTWPRTAEVYSSPRFPSAAFVVGDAAHAFPPTGGLGVNTGIADAHNLVWKIAAVEKEWTEDTAKAKLLLSTYHTERRPIAVANARQSVKNQVKLHALKEALRDPPDVDTGEEFVRWQTRLDAELESNREHFDSINLQIGYIYPDSANGRESTGEEGSLVRPCDVYIPSGAPGARLPHTWISLPGKNKNNTGAVSVLDLVEGTSFTLFVAAGATRDHPGFSGVEKLPVPVRVLRLGVDFDVADTEWVDLVGLSGDGPGREKGLLVRPDQHILGNVGTVADVETLLRSLLSG
ncbi:FAD binding domain-containing protein [Aspergillus keveii]|uniref:FAD binding domain-containing protein n=1 Tax=Aspergillus keveii TaxID=714993 RepID=A0ABR4GPW6_9EURO